MLEIHNAQEVLDRLQSVFEEAGVRVSISKLEKNTVHLDIERYAPGAPTAFLVQAIAGTYRRYLPQYHQTVLDNYVVLASAKAEAAPDKDKTESKLGSEPSLSRSGGPKFKGLPGLSLKGTTRSQAAEALESFSAIVEHQDYLKYRITDVSPETLPVLKQWAAIYQTLLHPQGQAQDIWIMHRRTEPQKNSQATTEEKHDPSCGVNEPGDTLPAKVLLISQPNA